MTSLDYITIKGFKSIACIEKLALGPINVVIGPNGSGKSNFLEAFNFVREEALGGGARYVASKGGANRLLHFGAKKTARGVVELGLRQRGDAWWHRVNFEYAEGDQLSFLPKEWSVPDPAQFRKGALPNTTDIFDFTDYQTIFDREAQLFVRALEVHHLNDTGPKSPLRQTQTLADNRQLRSDGSNLAPRLRAIREVDREAYAMILRTIQRVAPFIVDFELEPLVENNAMVRLQWVHRDSDGYFDAAALSDGTLRFIALAVLLLQPDGPPLIIIDEPELGLHPSAIALLASLIKMASKRAQVIVSTQSTLLLDHFAPEDVLVAETRDGGTTLARLDAARLADWLDEYSLGQLWEKNEIGGRP